jgi:glycosyltransferase involved in cell wall biosynthesis
MHMEYITMQEPGGRNNTTDHPVISCICITRGKLPMLKRAISCFIAQSYQKKELVIVYEDDDIDMVNFASTYNNKPEQDILFVCVRAMPRITLGELRNIGINKATGTYICQWDDDDWYHPNRLLHQYNALLSNGRHGAILTQWVVYDAVSMQAYISNRRLWEGSILCRKNVLQLKLYEKLHIGEDTDTVNYLAEKDHLHLINSMPELYIYIYHGTNTWHYEHWNYIFQCSDQLPSEDAACITGILDGTYSVSDGGVLLDNIIKRYYASKKNDVIAKQI